MAVTKRSTRQEGSAKGRAATCTSTDRATPRSSAPQAGLAPAAARKKARPAGGSNLRYRSDSSTSRAGGRVAAHLVLSCTHGCSSSVPSGAHLAIEHATRTRHRARRTLGESALAAGQKQRARLAGRPQTSADSCSRRQAPESECSHTVSERAAASRLDSPSVRALLICHMAAQQHQGAGAAVARWLRLGARSASALGARCTLHRRQQLHRRTEAQAAQAAAEERR